MTFMEIMRSLNMNSVFRDVKETLNIFRMKPVCGHRFLRKRVTFRST